MIIVELKTVTLVASMSPKVTAVAPVKFVPVMVTLVRPVIGPVAGATLTTVGRATYVYLLNPAAVPFGVVTLT